MSEKPTTPSFPPIGSVKKQPENDLPLTKKIVKTKRLPKIEQYKTFKPPERDYRDIELEKFSTFISSHLADGLS